MQVNQLYIYYVRYNHYIIEWLNVLLTNIKYYEKGQHMKLEARRGTEREMTTITISSRSNHMLV